MFYMFFVWTVFFCLKTQRKKQHSNYASVKKTYPISIVDGQFYKFYFMLLFNGLFIQLFLFLSFNIHSKMPVAYNIYKTEKFFWCWNETNKERTKLIFKMIAVLQIKESFFWRNFCHRQKSSLKNQLSLRFGS